MEIEVGNVVAMSENLRRQLSSPAALFVFEATARLGSFRSAAVELNVTQPSISYQIKMLEKHLGTKLFERRGRSISLTDSGEILFKAVERGFSDIQTGLMEIAHKANTNLVTICASSSAAAHFFLPRYQRLRSSVPEIDISLNIVARDINPATENADFAIRLGDGAWDDLVSWRLFDEVYFPLCAPNYFAGTKGTLTLEVLKKAELLFLKEKYRPRDDWRVFFDKVGSPINTRHERIVFSDQQPLLDAAVSGQGVGLGWLGMTDHFLAMGSLVRPIGQEVRTHRAFYLVAPRTMKLTHMAVQFRDWMIEEGRVIQSRWEQNSRTASSKVNMRP